MDGRTSHKWELWLLVYWACQPFQLRRILRDFPSTLDIRAIPTLVLWGDVLTMLSRAQTDAKFDLDMEEDAADENILKPRHPGSNPEDDVMIRKTDFPELDR